ncbi:methyltransferase family protein [Ferrimonas balearica]|uniref:methyltransferase family protein n=1 Tax=Ferrimonas balearica TaxID=44012 RepID=UPI001C59B198|nr:isoprenylcysteine carboxylmethyltransferase family protein [Ferrimonas balearica]MBW3140899.1 isoprenylcysteine carboxylmethyltransferase family protein [Ferrimonas balearica]MBW3165897.1 isoprenylcysteine carboxylmethyltransferase family protein [Ferrimonas balearica]MBY6225417.1 isoprenylcysteine carboxylmethyltransferase family protein [Ferrimonas balearica]
MRQLELKVPPVALLLLVGLIMWALADLTPNLPITPAMRLSALVVALLIGPAIAISGALAFRRADTTVNPTRPETSSQLVVRGIYKRSRNPMYLGMLVLLIGWGTYLASPAALAMVPLFMLYLNRFQIGPEERALRHRFGHDFERYCQRVRRWI